MAEMTYRGLAWFSDMLAYALDPQMASGEYGIRFSRQAVVTAFTEARSSVEQVGRFLDADQVAKLRQEAYGQFGGSGWQAPIGRRVSECCHGLVKGDPDEVRWRTTLLVNLAEGFIRDPAAARKKMLLAQGAPSEP